ncbi:MAG: hypothetical protein ABSF69_17935 [Polyangiaceae bacterium]|jgi:hypothetical protein
MAGFTLIGRLEYRRDPSDARVFEAAPSDLTHQDTLGFGLMTVY